MDSTSTEERRQRIAGRRAVDFQVYVQKIDKALSDAENASNLAVDAIARIDKHTALCEQQNITILEKLANHSVWREKDEAFQRKIMIGIILTLLSAFGASVMLLIGIVLRSTHLG